MSGTEPDITVVGGYYAERCVSPEVDARFGSGGRAALALAAAGRHVRWRYYCPAAEQLDATRTVAHENLEHAPAASDALVSFRYTHPLARPEYLPFPLPRAEPLVVEGAAVLRFGLMEGTGVVRAEACVYDPQGDPADFHENGSGASRLAIVLNLSEVLALGRAPDEASAVERLFAGGNLSALIVKAGADGCRVYENARLSAEVPPYQSARVYKIGTGDVFSAAFAENWMLAGRSAPDAADVASRCVAHYAQTRTPAVRAEEAISVGEPIKPGVGGQVYIAGPFFTTHELWLVEEAYRGLKELGVKVFSPYHEIGLGQPSEVVPADLAALDQSTAVLALLDGGDPGTLFEVGYATRIGLPVVALAQSTKASDLTMLLGSPNCRVVDDFSTALYHVAWAGRRALT
ncbi:PfkB family carbohydrate kinase [Roseovarius sp. MBR-6]|jgi:nucleoside 2-deoxyribosyltransferase|uniref:PfkB family carbohydrate kinase n=1 Tax=Roseovarius sp. MBR-6 TaxID=3156459 RepID=UPI0033948EF2